MKNILVLVPSFLGAVGSGCGAAPPAAERGGANTMVPQLASDLAVVRRARILFSHHSVGANILSGVDLLDLEAGGDRLKITSADAAPSEGPVLAHVSGGRNRDPNSKFEFFAATLRTHRALQPELAFMKLCYVDFEPTTDVDALFSAYERMIEALKREHPEIRLAHVTVPLVRRPTNLKASLRRFVGLDVWEDSANVKRSEFNRRLSKRFASDPVFDLARVEAFAPDGSVASFEQDGHEYLSLYAGYTEDGGHLNSLGRRVVGAAAIRFLADTLQPGRPRL